MYRNDSTERVAEAENGEVWQYILNEEDMENQLAENERIIKEAIANLKAELYVDYREKVLWAKASKKTEALNAWKGRVNRRLGVYLSENEVQAYITSVLNGTSYSAGETSKEEYYGDYYAGDFDEDSYDE